MDRVTDFAALDISSGMQFRILTRNSRRVSGTYAGRIMGDWVSGTVLPDDPPYVTAAPISADAKHDPSDIEVKIAILTKKAENDGAVLPADVARFMASNIRSNDVCTLEGAVIRVVAKASLDGVDPITVPYAQEVLKSMIEQL